ncbi:MAG TPA: hypothetical protein VMT11_11495 [Myxococcaceae bacterium]|nr:hypothetical protein [Myxococcaceae bacterium]
MRPPVISQNRAASVWAADREVLAFPPRSFTSLKSRAQSALFSAGGGGGRNSAPLCMTQGFTLPQRTPTGRAVTTYTPGVVTGR